MKHIGRIKIGACLFLVIYFAHAIGLVDQLISGWPMKNIRLALHMPESFGKTHFIVGYPRVEKSNDQVQERKQEQTLDLTPLTYTALFSPDDDVRGALIDLIEHEQSSINIAMFLCTDDFIARELIRARHRGVRIQLITDSSCLKDKNNKIALLCEHGIEVFVYNASDSSGKKNNNSCMHNKFILFASNGPRKSLTSHHSGKSLLWTGSCNATKSAYQFNQENIIIIQNQALYERYALQFDKLLKRAYRYGIFGKRR